MNKIPKNKILEVEQNDDTTKDEDDYDDIYEEEIEYEKFEDNVLLIQKCLLEYVNRKSLTLCEYLSTSQIKKYLRR